MESRGLSFGRMVATAMNGGHRRDEQVMREKAIAGEHSLSKLDQRESRHPCERKGYFCQFCGNRPESVLLILG